MERNKGHKTGRHQGNGALSPLAGRPHFLNQTISPIEFNPPFPLTQKNLDLLRETVILHTGTEVERVKINRKTNLATLTKWFETILKANRTAQFAYDPEDKRYKFVSLLRLGDDTIWFPLKPLYEHRIGISPDMEPLLWKMLGTMSDMGFGPIFDDPTVCYHLEGIEECLTNDEETDEERLRQLDVYTTSRLFKEMMCYKPSQETDEFNPLDDAFSRLKKQDILTEDDLKKARPTSEADRQLLSFLENGYRFYKKGYNVVEFLESAIDLTEYDNDIGLFYDSIAEGGLELIEPSSLHGISWSDNDIEQDLEGRLLDFSNYAEYITDEVAIDLSPGSKVTDEKTLFYKWIIGFHSFYLKLINRHD